ncbi:hypothetical protein Q8A67_019850 [Cirrhinus molitorella]|uniref:Uncharacterized protein n=1 Tax=Cirrhinus molitorella TaxID=172907 RepID=A0AA88P7W7_9TELE|nr:hypothetical protein Q8A67_019850 [Cirrhinus molitorella]
MTSDSMRSCRREMKTEIASGKEMKWSETTPHANPLFPGSQSGCTGSRLRVCLAGEWERIWCSFSANTRMGRQGEKNQACPAVQHHTTKGKWIFIGGFDTKALQCPGRPQRAIIPPSPALQRLLHHSESLCSSSAPRLGAGPHRPSPPPLTSTLISVSPGS